MAVKEFESGSDVLKFSDTIRKEVCITWRPPDGDWVKCNVDGSNKDGGSSAGCGGIIRDSSGIWKAGFRMKLDNMGILSTEIWGILKGLEMVWAKGFRRVIMESDSRIAVGLICTGCPTNHPLASLIQRITTMMSKAWEIRWSHCFRDANAAAHRLAKEALMSNGGLEVLEAAPDGLSRVIQKDREDVGVLRWIQSYS